MYNTSCLNNISVDYEKHNFSSRIIRVMPLENTKMSENLLVSPLSKLVPQQAQTKLMYIHTIYG
jgi:hypothetical protein